MKRKQMDQWIREALTDPDKDGKISMLSLVHMVGSQQKEIHTIKYNGGKSWSETELATVFRGKAETYVQDLQGVHTFQLLAFYSNKPQPEAFYPFTINVAADTGGLFTEMPNDTGRMQQVMRQSEMLIQQVYRRQQVMDDYTLRLIAQQDNSISTLQKENRDMFEVFKEIMIQQATNTHKFEMERLQYERSTTERQKLIGMAPHLINTITGREVFPQNTSDTALIESIAENISADHISMLAAILPPQLAGTLAERFMIYNQKKEEEHKALKAASAIQTPDPEADAAGEVVSISKGKGKHAKLKP